MAFYSFSSWTVLYSHRGTCVPVRPITYETEGRSEKCLQSTAMLQSLTLQRRQGNVESLFSGVDGALGTSPSLLTLFGLFLCLTRGSKPFTSGPWSCCKRCQGIPELQTLDNTGCLVLIGEESWTLGSTSAVSYDTLCRHSRVSTLYCQNLNPTSLLA